MELRRQSRRGSKIKRTFFFIVFIAIICFLGFFGYTYLESTPPQIALTGVSQYMGKTASVTIDASDSKTGLHSLQLVLKQDGQEHILLDRQFPRKKYTGMIGEPAVHEQITIDIAKEKLKEGKASLILTAMDSSFRHGFSGNSTTITKEFTIDTTPPIVQILHNRKYIGAGESGIVIYHLSGDVAHHGVMIEDHFNPGFPLDDGKKNDFIAYFALPYSATTISKSEIVASDAAGNSTHVSFSSIYKKVEQRNDKINISNSFLNAKIPEFQQHHPELEGSQLKKYITINNVVRTQNNKKISEICSKSDPQRYWEGRFLRMPGAQRAGFADHRTYYYNGEVIDHQVHLGVDLASVAHADVRAANSGKIVFASYLGIYGNMVIIDHGQGVFSLYSHLNQILVKVGDMVKKDQHIAITGKTGMAGGDHLHFSMLINGIFVTPKEWWDPQWVEAIIDGPIAEAKQ